ncbi:MAG TPA: leucyl aminopeptidase [Rhodothermales bacterium]|nr:leucyl aminopeptidase [Rhodothermales bacterium]
MKVSVTGIPLAQLDVDMLLAPLAEDASQEDRHSLEESFGEPFQRAFADFSGKVGADPVLLYPDKTRARRVALIGLGQAKSIDAERLRQAAAAGAQAAKNAKAKTVAILMPDNPLDPDAASQALVEGFVLGSYQFRRYKTGDENVFEGVERLVLHSEQDERVGRRGAERGRIVAESVGTARDLVNLSPDEKTPTLLSRAIEKSGKKYSYEVEVWDKQMIQDEGFGGLLAVNRGSQEPPTFTILTWRPENAVNEYPIVLVGKGVVFDTGGLSLKPTKDSMDFMKVDMAGAAAVVGTFEALARLEVPLYVVGLIPATDNRPGENAYVPGDVLRMHSGKTVEVLNTDAEGRLILADALSYARHYKPELVVDLATLTGAVVIALGSEAAGIMTNEVDGAADRITVFEAAGDRSGDRVHRLPMYEEYGKALESDVADLKNVGGREAGSITAAKFLENFVDYPWIHVDIAGTAFVHTPKPYRPKGGSGFGVRLLVEFLRDYASPRRRK